MLKQVVILGECGPGGDTPDALVKWVSETQPDELVLIEQSARLLEQLREVYGGPVVTGLSVDYAVAPGWIVTSRRDGYETSEIAGNTALRAAKAFGVNVVLGHTARMGIGSYISGYGEVAAKTSVGMEVGTCQQGIGLLTVDGQQVEPKAIPITLLRTA
jgi:hypothetical protein